MTTATWSTVTDAVVGGGYKPAGLLIGKVLIIEREAIPNRTMAGTAASPADRATPRRGEYPLVQIGVFGTLRAT